MRIQEVVGQNIKRCRETRGMSQAFLGKVLALNLNAPWSRQAVSTAENGRRDFRISEILGFALSLDVTVDYLLRTNEKIVKPNETAALPVELWLSHPEAPTAIAVDIKEAVSQLRGLDDVVVRLEGWLR